MSDGGGLTSGDPLGGGGGTGTGGSGPGGSVPSGQAGHTGQAQPGTPDYFRKREAPPREAERPSSGLPGGLPGGYSSPVPPGAGGFGHPEIPASGQLVLAGWWRRAGAALLDGLVIGLIAGVLFLILGIVFAAAGLFEGESADPSNGAIAAVIGTFFVVGLGFMVASLLYAPLMMSKTNGQTLGRMATGIRVVRTDGQPMTFGWSMLREVAVKWLLIGTIAGSFTLGLAALLDYLWPLWDEENRALHDFVVQTRTVLT